MTTGRDYVRVFIMLDCDFIYDAADINGCREGGSIPENEAVQCSEPVRNKTQTNVHTCV